MACTLGVPCVLSSDAMGACQSKGSAVRSRIDGSSFSGPFTRVEMGHMAMGSER